LIRLYYRGASEHIPQMGDFFLPQMDDVFAEGLCFDNRKEGKGERQPHAPPFCEEQSEGPEPSEARTPAQ
jgi:hypothetical protein